MKTVVPWLAMLALAVACGGEPEPVGVTAENVVVTLPALPGGTGAAYFTLRGGPARLTGIESSGIERAELHQTESEGGVSRMVPLADARVAPDTPLDFAPGGRHAMLHGLNSSLRPGDRLGLTFRLEGAPPVTMLAEVRGPGAAAR